ncbi:Uma2 family endonuclease [Roseomonas sp. NAR14]|uniref:Uma2 family endonuclease n=1 Tax=Roseomonas acroporae TaxID=2937791 RepID=A0A9X1YDT4_9PROT|nr:Uma2 family endonuclease [Roseomonas acroporae]MCK8787942.1 Uma2 family endonuclease [Roseomonas acroporae]
MSQPAAKPWTPEEFLAWEERQPLRYEFDGFQPVAMTGGTAAHSAIQGNLAAALVPRLRAGRCRFFNSDFKIETTEPHYRYPDGSIVCRSVAPTDTRAADPVTLFEVLSPSTADEDRYTKALEYQAIPSVQRYVMLEQNAIRATVLERSGESWTVHLLMQGSILRLPEAGIEVPLDELYEGIDFGAPRHQEPTTEAP